MFDKTQLTYECKDIPERVFYFQITTILVKGFDDIFKVA